MSRIGDALRNVEAYLRLVGIRGTALAAAGKLGGTRSLIAVRREGVKHPFHLRVPSSDVAIFGQVFENLEYDFHVTSPPVAIVDAGANIGLASIFFANKYPSATIISLEPEEGNFELLRTNAAPYKNIIPVHAALWNSNGTIDLIDPGGGAWGFMTQESNPVGRSLGRVSHPVKAMTVERIIADFRLEKINILKIDIEGAEKEVFEDTRPWISRVDAMIIELHEEKKPGCTRSFRNGSQGFDEEWKQGENLYLSKGKYLSRTVH